MPKVIIAPCIREQWNINGQRIYVGTEDTYCNGELVATREIWCTYSRLCAVSIFHPAHRR